VTIFKCPVCGHALVMQEKAYVCENKHTYDRASSGYVNLMVTHQNKTGVSGDNKKMVTARRDFLNKGYYEPLSSAINQETAQLLQDKKTPVIFDAGCGEGYYTSRLEQSFNNDISLCGADISKEAIKFASKRSKGIQFAVAGIFNLPVITSSVDCVLSVFAPYCNDEFNRILQDNGNLIACIPGKRHLYSLKEAVYTSPYENDEQGYSLPNFTLMQQRKVSYTATITGSADIQSLFMMTPYFYKSPADGVERLYKLEKIETEIEFIILVYKKSN
jgi:23S rRNA (guanine745-N1)-methyltransferase